MLKNNEKLAKAAEERLDLDQDSFRDQGFTRAKVLVLIPFRNGALEWQDLLSKASGCSQLDQKARFRKEFTLPEGAVDKLQLPEARQKFPPEHLETFSGNIDDSFTVGMKVTRKSMKLYSPFYDSDVILASPLGLRLAIDKEG